MSLKFVELTSHDYSTICAALYLQICELREMLEASKKRDPRVVNSKPYKILEDALSNTIDLLERFGETEENIEKVGQEAEVWKFFTHKN